MARAPTPTPAPRTVKSVLIEDSTAPTSPRYAAGKPAVPPELQTAPRADGGMSTGETGGNFQLPDVSTGAGQTQAGVDYSDPNA